MFKNSSQTNPNGTAPANLAPVLSQGAQAKRITQMMAGITAFLLIGAGGLLFLLNNSITAQQSIVAEKQSQVGNAEIIARRYNATFADYTETASQLRFLEKSVEPNAYIPTMLPQIAHMAKSYNLNVTSIRPGITAPTTAAPTASGTTGTSGATAPPPAYQTVAIDMTISGTYSQIMRFVYGLTSFPKVVTVKSISLHPTAANVPGQTGPDTLSAELSLTAYVFVPDPADALAATATVAPPIGSITQNRNLQSDIVGQTVSQPIGAAQSVQAQTQQRVESSGLQAQPSGVLPQTALGKAAK